MVLFRRIFPLLALAVTVGFALLPMGAHADPSFYQSPIFGIATAPGGKLLVAESGKGIVNGDDGSLIAALPNVSDVSPRSVGGLWAITSGEEGDQKLFRIKPNGQAKEVANLFDFEQANNPHPASLESNPFDVEDLGYGMALVADAAGNDLLKVNSHGKVKVVAVFPDELVSTENIKTLAGCPTPPPVPELEEICDLPGEIPAEPVPTSVAIGPDGAFYVGELKGFPAPVGESRVWRIERNANKAQCGQSSKCKVVFDGFTSIIDLKFGPDGRLYVAQLDDASWLAAEEGAGVGGSVHACNVWSKSCEEVTSGVPILTSIAFRCPGDGGGAEGLAQRNSHGNDNFCPSHCGKSWDFSIRNNSQGCGHIDDDCWDLTSHNKHDDDDDNNDECDKPNGFVLWGSIWALAPGQTDVVPLVELP